jgi:stage II sporulation protein M
MIQEYISFIKEYLFSLRRFILASFSVFILTLFLGYFLAQASPAEMEPILKQLQETFGPIMEMPALGQFLAIFLNNSLAVLLIIVLGITIGIYPFLNLLSNGLLLGIVVYFTQTEAGWPVVFAFILPHGVIELPVLIIACAIGFRIGKVSFEKFFKKQGGIKREMKIALTFFLKFLLPLLLLAAAIETLAISRLL